MLVCGWVSMARLLASPRPIGGAPPPSPPPPPLSRQWGTVCRWEGWFNEGAAKVACAQLGFSGKAAIVPGIDYSNDTSLPISITRVYCEGGEASLDACEFQKNSPDNPTCDHAGDVGLACSGGQPAALERKHMPRAPCWPCKEAIPVLLGCCRRGLIPDQWLVGHACVASVLQGSLPLPMCCCCRRDEQPLMNHWQAA